MRSKYILIFIKAIIDVIIAVMKEFENSGDVDADGVPLNDEYDKLSYLLSSLRSIVSEFDNEKVNYED